MDKALRNAIIAGIIIIALSLGYYLVVFLPKKEVMRLEQQKKEQELKDQKVKADKEEAKIALEKCFAEVDEAIKKLKQSYCRKNSGEIGDDGLCPLPFDVHEFFDNRARNEKDLCLKKYPQ